MIFSWVALLSPSSTAFAQLPLFDEASRPFQAHQWQFALQTNYFHATANYTPSGGQFSSLTDGYSYNLMTFDFGSRWVPMNRWGIYTSAQVANAESKDLIDTRRNSSFTEAVIGTDYLLYSSPHLQFYPDVSVKIPLERIDPNRDEVLNHEGAMEVSGRLIGRAHWGFFAPFAFVGYNYRDESRASLLPYGIGTEFLFTAWSVGGEVRGYSTASKDTTLLTDLQRSSVALRNGGALKFESTDPALLETNFWLKGSFTDSIDFKLGGGTSITGTNMASGWNVFAALTYSFLTGAGSRTATPDRRTQFDSEEAERFQEETNDGVNQNLFTRPRPQTPAPPPSAGKQKAEDKKKMQKEMDRAEFQIELKTTKKKKRKSKAAP